MDYCKRKAEDAENAIKFKNFLQETFFGSEEQKNKNIKLIDDTFNKNDAKCEKKCSHTNQGVNIFTNNRNSYSVVHSNNYSSNTSNTSNSSNTNSGVVYGATLF